MNNVREPCHHVRGTIIIKGVYHVEKERLGETSMVVDRGSSKIIDKDFSKKASNEN